MTVRRAIILPITLMSLTLVGTLFFSHTVFAQADQSALQAVKQTVSGKVAGVPANTTQACDGTEKAGGTLSLTSYCSSTAAKDGSTAFGIPFKAQDRIRCEQEVNSNITEQYCVVTHTDNSVDYYDAGNNKTHHVSADASGKITGGQIGATSNTFTGVVSTCVGGSTSDCVKAVVAPAANAALGGATDLATPLLRAVASAILTFANFLLGLAGAALNYVVYYTVFKFGSLIGNSPGVLLAWGILRDIANMLLLFGFIFLGVATILNADRFGTKKAIPRLLLFAILMNFSLFACEAVIDVANGASSLIYTQADPVSTQCLGSFGSNLGDSCSFLNYGIAGHIMQSTGLSTFYQNVTGGADVTALLALAVFATIGFIVLLSATIMLAIRLVVLTFLMIASPIGFAGMAIPFFQKFATDWWNRVIHQSFFAPIMFLLIFISLKIADSFSSVNGQNVGLGAVATHPDAVNMGSILIFMLVCGFLLGSVIFAHRFGAMGAQGAIGFSKKFILGTYGFVGSRTGGFAGRNTIGRASNNLQKKYNASAAKGIFRPIAGTGLDTFIGGTLKKGTEAKFGSTKSFNSVQDHHKERGDELSKIRRFEDAKKATSVGDMQKALKGLTSKQNVELINQLKDNEKQLGLIAQSISAEQLDKIYDNDEINDGAKEKMLAKRFEVIGGREAGGDAEDGALTKAKQAAAALAKDPDDPALKDASNKAEKELATRANSLNAKDIGLLARSKYADLLKDTDFVRSLSDDQFKEAKKNNHITEEQGREFQKTRDAMYDDARYVAKKIGGMNADAISKLGGGVIAKPEVLQAMTGRQLVNLKLDDVDDANVKKIVTHIEQVLTNPRPDARTAEIAEQFRARYNSSPRTKEKWRAEGINI